jgi:superfamily II DNA helicase RecQ
VGKFWGFGLTMRFHLFQYTLPADPDLQDLNAYLASHPVATVNQQIVTTAGGPLLVFVVETVGSAAGSKARASTPKVDYRDVLSDDEFAIFSQLREERKRVAEAEGVPVYAVFSNAHLAEMVTSKLTTTADISKIEGIGKARVEKYAAHFLPILAAAFSDNQEAER